jgi:hypothetical protein
MLNIAFHQAETVRRYGSRITTDGHLCVASLTMLATPMRLPIPNPVGLLNAPGFPRPSVPPQSDTVSTGSLPRLAAVGLQLATVLTYTTIKDRVIEPLAKAVSGNDELLGPITEHLVKDALKGMAKEAMMRMAQSVAQKIGPAAIHQMNGFKM